MDKKLLITIVILPLELEYEIYIPNNKKIGTIKKNFLKTISESLNIDINKSEQEIKFIDKENGIEFENNVYVKDSGIKNGSIILMI